MDAARRVWFMEAADSPVCAPELIVSSDMEMIVRIAEALEAYAQQEREACAELCEDEMFKGNPADMNDADRFADRFLAQAAKAIRARGQGTGEV